MKTKDSRKASKQPAHGAKKGKSRKNRVWYWIQLAIGTGAGLLVLAFIVLKIVKGKAYTPEIFQGIVTWLAELIVGFITTNKKLKIILLIINVPLYIIIGKLLFGGLKDFWRVEKYFSFPVFIRMTRFFKEDFEQEWAGYKLHIFLFWICVVLYLLQYALIKAIFLK